MKKKTLPPPPNQPQPNPHPPPPTPPPPPFLFGHPGPSLPAKTGLRLLRPVGRQEEHQSAHCWARPRAVAERRAPWRRRRRKATGGLVRKRKKLPGLSKGGPPCFFSLLLLCSIVCIYLFFCGGGGGKSKRGSLECPGFFWGRTREKQGGHWRSPCKQSTFQMPLGPTAGRGSSTKPKETEIKEVFEIVRQTQRPSK